MSIPASGRSNHARSDAPDWGASIPTSGFHFHLTMRSKKETVDSMRFIVLISFFTGLFALTGELRAQSAYAGTYDLILGYTTGPSVGKFGSTLRPGLGLASVSQKGALRATLYWPSDGQFTSLRGTVRNNGVFRFNSLGARLKLVDEKLGLTEFTDPQENRGFVVVRRKGN